MHHDDSCKQALLAQPCCRQPYLKPARSRNRYVLRGEQEPIRFGILPLWIWRSIQELYGREMSTHPRERCFTHPHLMVATNAISSACSHQQRHQLPRYTRLAPLHPPLILKRGTLSVPLHASIRKLLGLVPPPANAEHCMCTHRAEKKSGGFQRGFPPALF